MACPPARDSKEVEECKELVIDIPSDLPHAKWREYCIYRVPKQLRKVNKADYTPKLLSIGPFHHEANELKDMETHKLKYLDDFLKRKKISQVDLLKIIQNKEEEIRRCYSEDCRLESGDFVQMILLDAVFIIELFLKDKEDKKEKEEAKKKGEDYCEKESDYILSKAWLRDGILHDLILLENQLPFFILVELYMFAFNECRSSCNHHQEGQRVPFVQLCREYFEYYDEDRKPIIRSEEVKHLTDLLRYLFCSVPELRMTPRVYTGTLNTRGLYSATKLDYAGLKFKPVRGRSLLDITFSWNKCFKLSWLLAWLPCLKLPFPCLERVQSSLEIPQLVIEDTTEVVFRNLMALEQCHYPSHTYICSYVYLMNYLINTEQDVDLLVEKNVVVNYIGSNAAVATLFSKLCDQIVFSTNSRYEYLTGVINWYCDNCWNRIMASINGTYFRDFGRVIATVGVLLTLVGLFIPFLTK